MTDRFGEVCGLFFLRKIRLTQLELSCSLSEYIISFSIFDQYFQQNGCPDSSIYLCKKNMDFLTHKRYLRLTRFASSCGKDN